MRLFYPTARCGSTLRSLLLVMVGMLTPCCAARANDADPRPNSQRPKEFYADGGYVWVNQTFLEGPYRVSASEQGLQVNGTPLSPMSESDRMNYRDWDSDWVGYDDEDDPADAVSGPGGSWRSRHPRYFRGRFDRHMHRPEDEFVSLASILAAELSAGAVVVSLPDQPLGIFTLFSRQVNLFELLASDGRPDPEATEGFLAGLPSEANPGVWQKWAETLQLSPEVRSRISAVIEAGEERERTTMAKRNALQRMDLLAYPLTVLGMMLAVLSLGHLLMCLPRPYDDAPTVPSAGMMRATNHSLMLVVALSGMDLVWTLLASQAGQMKELNPLASRLIHDPQLLIAFKTAATAFGCGVLYKLRHHSRAQFATWWLCLVCTVLAFRWLTFNSMFVA